MIEYFDTLATYLLQFKCLDNKPNTINGFQSFINSFIPNSFSNSLSIFQNTL